MATGCGHGVVTLPQTKYVKAKQGFQIACVKLSAQVRFMRLYVTCMFTHTHVCMCICLSVCVCIYAYISQILYEYETKIRFTLNLLFLIIDVFSFQDDVTVGEQKVPVYFKGRKLPLCFGPTSGVLLFLRFFNF